MMKNLPSKTHATLVSVLWLLFCIIMPNVVQAKSYHKLMLGVAVGMDSIQVVEKVGVPTHSHNVERFFYLKDQVVLINGKVADIRVKDRVKPTHKNDKIAKRNRPISMLRIGMNYDEVVATAGEPNHKEEGVDLYFSNRHRVEFTNSVVREVEMHIKKEMEILDWIRLNFSKGGLLFMNITLAFIMFGVALEIKLKHFREIIKKPKSALVGIFSQFIALPALTFLLVLIIKPTPSVALGMILVAACPGGNISNFISSLSKANIELSVSLTAFATLTAIVLTPLNFAFWGGLYSGTADMVIPIKIDVWEMMQTVFILLGVPIVVGTWFAYKFPKVTQKIIKPLRWFSLLAFMGFILAALASNFQFFLDYIHFILIIVFVHNLLALATGFSLATFFGLPRPDRRTLTIETGIQNSGLGLVLIFNPNLFDGLGGMAFIAAWWGIWHILAGLGIASIFSRKPFDR